MNDLATRLDSQEYPRLWGSAGLRYLLAHHEAGALRAAAPELPAPFDFYWQRTPRSACIVWTYWELDQDLRGRPDPGRMSLWKAIMLAKKWKEDQVCFWPLAVREDLGSPLSAHPPAMVEAVRFLQPRYVLCFGSEVQRVLKEYFLNGTDSFPDTCTIVHLPGPGEMLPDNKAAKLKTWRLIQHLQT